METFTITDDHIKLARRMYVSWEDCEYGAPAIDCKRPYGNSSVDLDIAEILGWDGDEEDDAWREAIHERANAIHHEMQTVLQIALRVGRFEPGAYEADPYMENWRSSSR